MSENSKNNSNMFSHYLLTSKLDELEALTSNLFEELQDSKKVMSEIFTMMNAIPQQQSTPHQNNGLRHEDISQFLVAPTPNLLLSDMSQNTVDVDLDSMIADMKKYAESIKNNINNIKPQQEIAQKTIDNINWDECASSLDQFGKRIASIKTSKAIGSNRNMELEAKMDVLCKDINMFTQVIITFSL